MSAAHHVEDVGKILLQAQSDLRRIREQLAPPGAQGEAAFVSEQLAQVVEKAEAELRLKAEAVLSTTVHGAASTLPAMGAYNFRSASAGDLGPAHAGAPAARSALVPPRPRRTPSRHHLAQ